MFRILSKLLQDDSGAGAIEYSLIAALISVTAVAAIAG
jgi:Flp pilus assembly pilin Flp